LPFILKWERIHETVLGHDEGHVLTGVANRRLFQRWTEAGSGDRLVSRDAFDVMELRDLLGALCVHDYDPARDDFRCRVFGGTMVSDFGIDMTGRYFSDHVESTRNVVRAQYRRVMTTRRPLVAVYRAVQFEPGETPLEVGRFLHEKLILPVTRDGRSFDCFVSHIARLPFDAALPGPARTAG
jgi:hypothetical protein